MKRETEDTTDKLKGRGSLLESSPRKGKKSKRRGGPCIVVGEKINITLALGITALRREKRKETREVSNSPEKTRLHRLSSTSGGLGSKTKKLNSKSKSSV